MTDPRPDPATRAAIAPLEAQYRLWLAQVQDLPEETLELLAASDGGTFTQTNCGWAEYQTASIIAPEARYVLRSRRG